MERFDLDELEEDELEKRERQAKENIKRKRRRRKMRRRIFFMLLVGLLALYLLSPYANINLVEVEGNVHYTKQDLMDIAGIDYDMKSFLAPFFLMEYRLESDDLIAEADVKKTWNGIVKITIEEKKLVGYTLQEDVYYIVTASGESVAQEDVDQLIDLPYIVDLDEDQLQQYAAAMEDVDQESIQLISEVSHYETSYDDDMLELLMVDQHIVHTTYEGLALLDSYTEMVVGINTNLQCIVFAEETNTIYTEKCE